MSGERAVAVVLDGPRVLLIKRYLHKPTAAECIMCRTLGADGDRCPGHHYAVLPGGHVEPGEQPAAAVVRELTEETTLTGRVERLLWTGRHNERAATYFLIGDLAGRPELSGPELAKNNPNNSYELVWASADQLDALGVHPADVRGRLATLLRERLAADLEAGRDQG